MSVCFETKTNHPVHSVSDLITCCTVLTGVELRKIAVQLRVPASGSFSSAQKKLRACKALVQHLRRGQNSG
jgi:hypothetical protein